MQTRGRWRNHPRLLLPSAPWSARLADWRSAASSAREWPLGGGEPLLAGIDLPALGYQVSERVATELALHVVLTKRG